MDAAKYIAIIVVALICLAIVAPFLQARTPEAYVAAQNESIRMQPTATAAALANEAAAIRVTIVAPAQATAEAASILANNQQRISEDAHQQAMRHEGELAALTVTNTMRVNEVLENFTARIEGIKASGAKQVAEFQADAARATAGAWRDTGVNLAVAIGALILLAGAAASMVLWLNNRARIIDHPATGPILITRNGAMLLGRVVGPAIAVTRDGQFVLPIGVGQAEVTARQQSFALINGAMKSKQPEMAKVAERAATAVIQQSVATNPILDSAVAALPASRDDLARRVPTFAELLRTWRPSIEQMLFGFGEDGRPVYGSLDQLLSALVIGRQGQGKTTLLRLINLQCAMTGVQVIGWDIHDDIAEDVPGIETHTRVADIEQSARELNAELDRRISLKLKHDKARPIMVLIDEVNLVVDRVPMLVDVIKRVVSEGRKYRVFEFITAKGAPSDLFEKSWARDSFSALISFWTSSLQARNAGFESDSARRVETLTPGHALLRLQTAPAQVVTFPDLSLSDMQKMVSVPASGSASTATSGPLPETAWMVSGEAGNPDGNQDFASMEAAGMTSRVREMLLQGKSQREIIAELWQQTGGRGYQDAARELNDILRRLVQ